MLTPRVLVVESESDTRAAVTGCLRSAGYDVSDVGDAIGAHTYLEQRLPHLAVLSATLPRAGAAQLIGQLRASEATASLAILMLVTREQVLDQRATREASADAMVRKPVAPQELIEKAERLLANQLGGPDGGRVEYGGVCYCLRTSTATCRETAVHLGPTEGRMLALLLGNPERVYSRAQLLGLLWSSHVRVEERTVDVHVRRLRETLQKLGVAAMLQTVRGVGYRLSSRLA